MLDECKGCIANLDNKCNKTLKKAMIFKKAKLPCVEVEKRLERLCFSDEQEVRDA